MKHRAHGAKAKSTVGDLAGVRAEEDPEPRLSPDGAASERQSWQEYEYLGDLYKFYLDLLIKAVVAFFAIVGGVLTLVLANVNEKPIVVVALVVPFVMSVLMALAAWKARPKVKELRIGINRLGRSLDVAVEPHVEILDWAVSWFSLLSVTAAGLLAALLSWLIATA
jgi:hypothetical protein